MAEDRSGLVRSAGIIAIGNVASRLLGLVRVTVVADLFGATGLVSAFEAAARVPMMIYDLLVSGMLSAAVVPVLSEYADRKEELWQLASVLLTVIALIMGVIVALLEIFAPTVAWVMVGGFEQELIDVTTRLIRIILPATILFGLSGVATGVLYSLKRFTYPAFGAAVYNLGIVVAAPLLAGRLDIYSLGVGVLAGSLMQLAIQLPDLLRGKIAPRIDFSHPALRRIVTLYLPIAAGLVISQIQIIIDRRLASGTGEQSIAWMANATQIIQFPHGLVSVAISLAVLPSLSRYSARAEWEPYRRTLAAGIRMVIVLIVPAIVALYLLGKPVVRLIFEHGRFTAGDTRWVTIALFGYLLGLLFASIDWPLNYAFYARQDTLTPALVGLFSVVVYLAVALPLVRSMGMLGLVLADSAKHASHAMVMWWLLRRRVGPLRGRIGITSLKSVCATAGMGLAMWGTMRAQGAWLTAPPGFVRNALDVLAPAAVGAGVYLALALLLRVGDLADLWQLARARLARSRPA
jgi:putative peptidoglycan lipid II flippase